MRGERKKNLRSHVLFPVLSAHLSSFHLVLHIPSSFSFSGGGDVCVDGPSDYLNSCARSSLRSDKRTAGGIKAAQN